MQKTGTLIINDAKRLDIRFDLTTYHGSLQVGDTLELLLENRWIETTVGFDVNWYLSGIRTDNLIGLRVKITL